MLNKDDLQLIDGVTRNAEHSTFKIPPKRLRVDVEVGQFIKLGWEIKSGVKHSEPLEGERMWVRVTDVCGTKFTGKLDNDPFVFAGVLHCGDEVEFGPEHVLDVLPALEPHEH